MAKPLVTATRVASPPEKPTLLWDGDCGFCQRCACYLQRKTGDAVAYHDYQSQLQRWPELSKSALATAVHLVEPDGHVTHSAEAIFRTVSNCPGQKHWLRRYRRSKIFATLSEFGYRRVANNRMFFSKLTKLIFGPGEPALN